jgi:RHS repeat-associated protein
LGSDTYDNDGNTINSLGTANAYDFENHMVQDGFVTIVYDGDGNRVSETVAGVTTNFLVDTQNPTGYAQVVDELQSSAVTRTYSYGLERISESQTINSTWTPSFYGYDGHGSVRQLTDSAGAVTDSYDYDAFGNLSNSTGSTPNNYLFAGEQHDPALSLYYNRARYLSTTTGRFWSMDADEGSTKDPGTLHKYLYSRGDPVGRIDPSGHDSIAEFSVSFAINATLNAMSTIRLPGSAGQFIANALVPSWVWQDLANLTPDAVEVGANVGATFNTRIPVGVTVGAGVEILVSPKTGNDAMYTYVGGGITFGSTATSVGGGGTAGLIFNCPRSDDYEGQFLTLTVPMAALPPSVRSALAGDWQSITPSVYDNLIPSLAYGLGMLFSENGSINVFYSPSQGSTHAFGVSLGVGGSIVSVGSPTSNWALSDSYYWQDYPSGPTPFR